jgi:orotate phosphoribosyltransferase
MSLVKILNQLDLVKKGKFVLKSGKVSNYYIDIKKAFGHPKAFNLICDELCKIIDKRATCVAGSGHGGLPLATAVSLKLNLPLVLVRDKVKKHGINKMIDGYIPNWKDNIAIIDDVFTTGTCIYNISEALKPTKAKILGGYLVVKRGDTSKFDIPVQSLISVEKLTN